MRLLYTLGPCGLLNRIKCVYSTIWWIYYCIRRSGMMWRDVLKPTERVIITHYDRYMNACSRPSDTTWYTLFLIGWCTNIMIYLFLCRGLGVLGDIQETYCEWTSLKKVLLDADKSTTQTYENDCQISSLVSRWRSPNNALICLSAMMFVNVVMIEIRHQTVPTKHIVNGCSRRFGVGCVVLIAVVRLSSCAVDINVVCVGNCTMPMIAHTWWVYLWRIDFHRQSSTPFASAASNCWKTVYICMSLCDNDPLSSCVQFRRV